MNEASESNVTSFPETKPTPSEPAREALLVQPNEELLDEIRASHEAIKAATAQRKANNQQISAEYKRLEGLGIAKKSAKVTFGYFELEEEQRRMFDLSTSTVRKALNLPIQGELFQEEQLRATVAQHNG